MAELPEEQIKAIEDYLSKEVALTKAQQKAIEDYISNRADLSRAEKGKINSYLRTLIFSVLGILGITTIIAFTALWNRMVETVKRQAVNEVTTQVNQDLKDNSITRDNLFTEASRIDGQLSLLAGDIATIQNNVDTTQKTDLNQLGKSIKEFKNVLDAVNPNRNQVIQTLVNLGTRITALENYRLAQTASPAILATLIVKGSSIASHSDGVEYDPNTGIVSFPNPENRMFVPLISDIGNAIDYETETHFLWRDFNEGNKFRVWRTPLDTSNVNSPPDSFTAIVVGF
jgi:hypothetical protein